MRTFQQIIQDLTQFWEKQGCIIHQGHDVEVGAGTFNPATFLRCLGPEPYNAAYVEPSRRPTDGRYGLNPNRLQLFHQFQVIMKPSPDNIQELYLDSLRALGLDLSSHDIRFVHDDWESPTLGAWGLGWEVWIDGMEITQFTYFQAIGSIPLHPVSAEIAYGIERLAMYIQNVDNIFDVKWNNTLTLGDIAKQSEWEWSTYNFEESSAKMWSSHFTDYEKEAARLIDKKLPIPAYDFVLKASHAFNMLDARGVISVTERTGYIARIRDLARLVATGYLDSRKEKNFPLLHIASSISATVPTTDVSSPAFSPEKTEDFLLEIGSEQLPATFVPIGMRNLEHACKQLLELHSLTYQSIACYGTPQRLAIHIQGLVEGTKDSCIEKKGPPISSAFHADGSASPQGIGFFRSLGYTDFPHRDSLQNTDFCVRSIKDTPYLFYTQKTPSRSTYTLLQQALPSLIANLEFPKKMRWGSTNLSYARPLHWIVCLLGNAVIPFTLETITSGRKTKGHTQLSASQVDISHPTQYLPTLRQHYVLADPIERKTSILEQLAGAEAVAQGSVVCKEKVLSQVLYLTEWPRIMEGRFSEKFLRIPKEVLISEMVEHQKYFPIEDASHALQARFFITADNTPCTLIGKGNEKVLSARLEDGVFLYEQDVKIPLMDFVEKLQSMTFQQNLGSMKDKAARLQKHCKVLHEYLPSLDLATLEKSALLCKGDLASALVAEFPHLQGTIGKYYALAQGYSQDIALAIEEHWMPISESGSLPATSYGTALAIIDKIDNLLGYFSVGLKPSSSSDPYALRRQTFGLLKMLIEHGYQIDLRQLLLKCAEHFPNLSDKEEVVEEILSFITHRAKSLFEECGYKKDEMDASLQGSCTNPFVQLCKLRALHSFRLTPSFTGLYEVFKRTKGLLDPHETPESTLDLLVHPKEKDLLAILIEAQERYKKHLAAMDFFAAFETLSTLQPPLSALLDEVKVLDPDPAVRKQRVALINQVFGLFDGLLDFSKIQEL